MAQRLGLLEGGDNAFFPDLAGIHIGADGAANHLARRALFFRCSRRSVGRGLNTLT